jgi:RNA polymerase sigma-70 factor (ECF subfamily)
MTSTAFRRGAVGAHTGDSAAADLFAAHYARLAGWIRRLVDDDDTAHEIASEAFARLLARWSRVDDPAGYLYVLAANLVRDHWRRTRRARRLQATEEHRSDPATTTGPDVDLRVLITTLPERLRAPVLLHYFADFAVADVARLLGRPEGTVKSDLHQARKVLRTALEGTR